MRLIDADALTEKCGDWYVEEGTAEGFIGTLGQLLSGQSEMSCSDIPNSSDTISRQQAVDALRAMQTYKMFAGDDLLLIDQVGAQTELMMLPSVQPEQTKMIKEIREWINSGNRGSADYFIVDKIEEILNKYE